MHTSSRILIRAPRSDIFEVTTDLSRWPELLPHYRFVHFLEKDGDRSVVKMAARRGWIPISWVSEHTVDRAHWQMRFRHLRAFTKGMEVVWEYHEREDGVEVVLRHDLKFRVPMFAPVAEPVIGRFFIEHIANKTLRTFKAFLENR